MLGDFQHSQEKIECKFDIESFLEVEYWLLSNKVGQDWKSHQKRVFRDILSVLDLMIIENDAEPESDEIDVFSHRQKKLENVWSSGSSYTSVT